MDFKKSYEDNANANNTSTDILDNINISAPETNIENTDSYKKEQKRLQAIKDKDFSIENTASAIFKTGIPFGRVITEPESRGTGIFGSTTIGADIEEIDYSSKKIQDIYNSVGTEHWSELNEKSSVSDLIATRNQINNAKKDLQYVSNQHGFGATLALYGAASLLDPITYIPVVGQSKKFLGAVKLANTMSRLEKIKLSASVGGQVALATGASEAIIQSQGGRDYSQVPVTMAFAFALGSGATHAVATLKNINIARKEEAISKLSNTEWKVGDDISQVQTLLDVIKKDGEIQPVRSLASRLLSKIVPHGNNRILTSPTYRAFMEGGKASSFARLVDTPAGLSTKADGTIVEHVNNTVMDVKYQTYEDFISLEIQRHKTFKKMQEANPQLKESDFTEAVWRETHKLRQQYEARIDLEERRIRAEESDEIIKDIVNNSGEKVDRSKYQFEEEYNADLDKYVKQELDKEIRRRAIKSENELGIKDNIHKDLEPMINAQSEYYGKMNDRMLDAGFEDSDLFLPKYYSPIMYDNGAIKMANQKEVQQAFETAIRESESYKRKLADIDNKIEEAKAKVISEKELDLIKEQELLIDELQAQKGRLEDLQQLDFNDIDFNAYKADIRAGKNNINEIGQEDIIIDSATSKKIADIGNKDELIKHLSELSGIRLEDVMTNMNGLYNNSFGVFYKKRNAVGVSQDLLKDMRNPINKQNLINTLRHEYIHAISTKLLDENPAYRAEIREIMNSMTKEIKLEFSNKVKENIKDDIGKGINDVDGMADYVKYLMKDEDEFLAYGLSNKYMTNAFNDIKFAGKTGEVKSVLSHIFDKLKELFGIKINKDSYLDAMFSSMERNTKRNTDIETKKLASEAQAVKHKMEQIYAKDGENGLSVKDLTRLRNLYDELGNIKLKMEKSLNEFDANLRDSIQAKEEELYKIRNSASTEIEHLLAEKIDIEAEPRLASTGMIKAIKDQKTMKEQVGFSDVVPNVLKARKLNIDVTHPAIRKYVKTNEAQINQMYQYTMSGRISTKKILGTDSPNEMRQKLIDNGFNQKEIDMSMDTFELALGTKQIPDNPDNNWEKAVRMISHVNYLTMGGQFAKSGLTEIGSGIYRAGFEYIRELVPALDNVIKMYRGKDLPKWADDARSMSEASDIYANNFLSSHSDTDYIESTFSKGMENVLKKTSQKFFRYSGLEGITTLTQIALPRAFLRKIIKEANKGFHGRDLMRWGINKEDMDVIARQPIKKDKNGDIIDFNFEEWEDGVSEKFMVATQRMSRDAIMRPDAVRLPVWVNDGNTNPLFKLAKQFMTFTMLSHERLMMSGMNERSAMAMVGASVSAAIMIAMEKVGEELAVSTGVMDDKDRYYTDKDKGWERLFARAALRNPMMGNASTGIETTMDLTSGYGQDRAFTRVIGGPTGARALTGYHAISDAISGKYGTRNQVNTLSSLIPAQNMIGIAAYTSHLKKDIINYSKQRDYFKNE